MMKVVEVTLRSSRDDEDVDGTFIVEEQRGDVWNRSQAYDVTSGTDSAHRTFLLEDNERIVVMGRPTEVIVLDRDQRAAVRLPADREERERKKREDAAVSHAMNQAAEERSRRDAAIARGELASPHVSEPPEGVKKAGPMETSPDLDKVRREVRQKEGQDPNREPGPAKITPRSDQPDERGKSASQPPPGIAPGGARSSTQVKKDNKE